MPASHVPSICAVIVTFHPDEAVLRAAVDAISPQVDAVVVVDNSVPAAPARPSPVVTLGGSGNVGLAAAQNVGIAWARDHGHTHVALFDQDSVAAADMVARLHAALQNLSAHGDRVAAVGPQFHDPREQREAPFVRVAFPVSRKLWCDAATPYVECDFLISSGVLIPLTVLAEVGPMDEGIFIDNVDLEWSFRARAAGYRLYGVCGATMEHALGDSREPVLGGRAHVVRHGPVRLYFIMRNRLLLYRLPHTPRVWIAQDVPRVAAKFFIFSVLVGPRPRNVRYMLRGLLDGLRGRRGPCPIEVSP